MATRRDSGRRDPYDRGDDPGQTALPLDDEVYALAWSGDVPGVVPDRPLPAAWEDEDWDDDRWDVPGQGELPLDLAAGSAGPAGAARGEGDDADDGGDHGDDEDSSSHGRAGRNLKAAIGVGVFLAALILVTLFTYPPAFVVVVTAAIVLGTREVTGALREGGAEPSSLPVAAAGGGLVVAAYVGGPQALATGLLLAVLALAAIHIGRDPRTLRRDLPASAFAVAYVGFLAGFAMLLLRPDDGVMRVVTFITLTTFSDIGGYATGVLSGGRHKLAPTVSPGKSWEGLGGSLAVCGLTGALFVSLGLDGSAWQGVLVGLVIAVAATVGDLGESVLKRAVGVKDMGSLLPGHGGLMDRLDSLLVVAPIAWVALALVVPTS